MRWTSLVTILVSLAALILALLCLFAGTTRTFLQSGDILTLNVSQIGQIELFNTTSEEDDNFLEDLLNDAQETANDLLGDAAEEVAQRLNISDFYAVHVMNYCEGEFEPNGTLPNAKKNTTRCSRRNALFSFDPAKTIEDELPEGVTLEDLRWPEEIDDAVKGVRAAAVAMFCLWCIGIGFAGLTAIFGVVSFFTHGRLSACGVFVLSVLAFLSLGIAAAIATAISVKATNAINKHGEDIGVSARRGGLFLGMSWAAAGAMLIAMVVAIMQVVRGRKDARFKPSRTSKI